MDAANEIIGIWNLIQWTTVEEDGRQSYPYGEDAVGQISYDGKGNMMVAIMRPEREPFASNNFLQGTVEEIVTAYNGFVAYCGTYDIDPVANMVIHHITICSFPNWVGQDQIRYYNFQNDLLILKAPAIGTTRHQLTWQKKY